MSERPILMSAPMVKALLAGAKVQTRRLLKPQPQDHHWQYAPALASKYAHRVRLMETGDGPRWRFSHALDGREDELSTEWKRCPYGQPGDLLWVRETWQDFCPMWNGAWCGHGTQEGIAREHQPVYRADDSAKWLRGRDVYGKPAPPTKWRPSIHMPKWAARLWLEIVEVRCERLNAISEEDYFAEGFRMPPTERTIDDGGDEMVDAGGWWRREFGREWDAIHGRDAWQRDKGKWVWAITFRRTEAPQKEAA